MLTELGSTHRYQISKLSVAEIRSMFRNTTRNYTQKKVGMNAEGVYEKSS